MLLKIIDIITDTDKGVDELTKMMETKNAQHEKQNL